jgi:Ca2+-binding RTX toxin-like protein
MALFIDSSIVASDSRLDEYRGNSAYSFSTTPSAVSYGGVIIVSAGLHFYYPQTTSTIYNGFGLQTDVNQNLLAGTVTSISGVGEGSFSNLNVSAAAIGQAQASADGPAAVWSLLTSGDDQFFTTDLFSFIFPVGDIINAGAGNDTIYASGFGDDKFIGGSGSNVLAGNGGNDLLIAGDVNPAVVTNTSLWSYAGGGEGNDTILSGYGANAHLAGGTGNDVLVDGLGTDVLNGGAGSDYFAAGSGTNYLIFNQDAIIGGQCDVIDYFNAANNYIQLAAIYEGSYHFTQFGNDTYISLSTYGILVENSTVANVLAHTYYF